MDNNKRIDWETKGKSIELLIQELSSFDDKTLEVRLKIDRDSDITYPISLIGKVEGKCLLMYCDPD